MRRLIRYIEHTIHNRLLSFSPDASRAYNIFVHGYRQLYYTIRSRKLHRTFVDSAALTLHTLFAAIPLLAFILIILGRLGAWQPVEASLRKGFSDWGDLIDSLLIAANSAAENLPNGIFAIIGLGSMMWFVFIVFRGVEGAFNHIWGVRAKRGLIKRYVSYTLIVIFVPILWGFATTFTMEAFLWSGLSNDISSGVSRLISIAVTAFGTALLYKYLPHAQVRWRYALIIGTLVGVVLMLWQWGYVYIQGYMTAYNAIYGSFTAIPLFIIWLQVSWNIILFGCELCCVWHNTDYYETIDARRLGIKQLRNKAIVRVVIVGSGNVAEAFARTLTVNRHVLLQQIFARNEERGRSLASQTNTVWTNRPEELADADIYIISVSDRAVEEVAHALPFKRGSIVVHTAGSVALSVLPNEGVSRGILYAFQSFSAGRQISLSKVPIFIEAEDEATRERLAEFAHFISERVAEADSERRRSIHLAGVFVNNFTNNLYALGADIMAQAELNYDMLKPLIEETAAKAVATHNPRKVQTGPAVRGDRAVCDKHLEMLAGDDIKQKIYKDITESIWETSKKI